MAQIGFTLSCEEHPPPVLLRQAGAAERSGFDFVSISDHYHPWIDRQGNAPFVWAVIGGVSQVTERIELITAVTCPSMRIHPAIIAQAAATAACMLPGRFSFGVGSGENLNEHILGDRWPSVEIRQERLEEAIEVIRALWQGGLVSHRGRHFEVENARVYTLPEQLPPILVATAGPQATELAARVGDGLIGLVPNSAVPAQFRQAGGAGKPTYGQVHVCWAETEAEAMATARDWWPNTALPGNLFIELPLPSHFEEATAKVTEAEVAESIVCGPDPARHLEEIRNFIEAGYSHVFVHQVGPDRPEFFEFYRDKVLPELRRAQ